MHADVITALNTDSPLVFFCLEVVPEGMSAIRLLDASGVVGFSYGGDSLTFSGEDATYGTAIFPERVLDGLSSAAPTLNFSLLPNSDSAAITLRNALTERSTVRMWGPGAVNRETGASLGVPERIFIGYVERAILLLGQGVSRIDIEAVGALHRLLDRGDGRTLSDASHQSIWPGEKGFEFNRRRNKTRYWGRTSPGEQAAGGSATLRSPFNTVLAAAARGRRR